MPAGYRLNEDGAVAESDKGNQSVIAILPVTLFCMLLLLMLQLRRISRMLLALLMAPFGLPGIVLAMLPTGTDGLCGAAGRYCPGWHDHPQRGDSDQRGG